MSYTDPSKLYGSLMALVMAVLAALPAFGVALDPAQQEAVSRVLSAAAPFAVGLTAWLIRRKAWAPASVDREVDDRLAIANFEDNTDG